MATNSVALTIYQRPSDGAPLTNPVIRYFTSDQIQEFYADTTVANANTAINAQFGKKNGFDTGIYLVAETIDTLAGTPLANFIPLNEYTLFDGSQPATPALRYVNPAQIQDYYIDTASGISGANSQVDLQFRKGNGWITGNVLVAQTVATIKTALG